MKHFGFEYILWVCITSLGEGSGQSVDALHHPHLGHGHRDVDDPERHHHDHDHIHLHYYHHQHHHEHHLRGIIPR